LNKFVNPQEDLKDLTYKIYRFRKKVDQHQFNKKKLTPALNKMIIFLVNNNKNKKINKAQIKIKLLKQKNKNI